MQSDLVKMELIAKYLDGDEMVSNLDFATLILLSEVIIQLRCSIESCYGYIVNGKIPYIITKIY